MFAILLIALCVVTAHAQYYGRQYSCPPDTLAAKQFRMMTADLNLQEVPIVEEAKRDLYRASSEIRNLIGNSVSEALSYKTQFQLLIHPFVSRCCKKPHYNCSHEKIPMRFINYNYNYYYYYYRQQFCFVVYPAGEKTIHYTKCTCLTCIRDDCCPVIGRCVETDYTYHYIIVYCPKFYYGHRFKILLVAVPKDCKCMTYCPYTYYRYGYGYGRSALGPAAGPSASQAALPSKSAAAAQPAETAVAADEDDGSPEEPSEIPGRDGQPPDQEAPTE